MKHLRKFNEGYSDWSVGHEIPFPEDLESSGEFDDYHSMCVAYAKMHVKAALEAAADRAVVKENPEDYGTGKIWVDRDSIINAYPVNDIGWKI